MYAKYKGVANLVCKDGSYTILPDTLYVPGLGVNLLSARRICEAGLVGSFDESNMFFKSGDKVMIRAKMNQGLYIFDCV